MRYKKFLFGIGALVGVISCLFLLSYFFSSRAFRKGNKVIVGVAYDYEPFSFVENDELVGFDVDLMSAISKSLQKNAQFKTMSTASLLDALSTKKIDVAISGIRESQVSTAEFDVIPYKTIFVSNFRCIMSLSDGGEKKIGNTEIGRLKGKVGAVAGTPEEFFLVDAHKNHGEVLKIFSLPNGKALIDAMKDGAIDSALVLNYQFLRLNEAGEAHLKCVPLSTSTPENLPNDLVYDAVIVIRKNSYLKGEIKDALEDVVSSGRYDALKMSWLTGGIPSDEE